MSTTLTIISEEESPSIYTSPENTVSSIDPLIYGGFTEYVEMRNTTCRLMRRY
jgi:hypothetical protein